MKFKNTFEGKKVLLTGHTGFKGSWLAIWLDMLGADVVGLALDPPTEPSHFDMAEIGNLLSDNRVDIRDHESLKNLVVASQPDIVIHLAAQSLVRKSYEAPLETWETNVMGTLNLLESLRYIDKKCAVVLITSDKCYDNVEWVWGYRETDKLGGPDPYSASKAAAEIAISSYYRSSFSSDESPVKIASARAGNVIGGGDWALDRIIPDCIRAWSSGKSVDLRNPASTRPWQHVLEPLSGYLCLAADLYNDEALNGESFNFGPDANVMESVEKLVEEMALHWNKVAWKDVSGSETGPYESGLLKLNCDKALAMLGWMPTLDFSRTVEMTVSWYGMFYQEKPTSMQDFSRDQILQYCTLAREQGMGWAND